MVTQTFDISAYRLDSRAAGGAQVADELLGYRLDVLGASAVDVVQAAGGWLYDRVMAGWRVSAVIPQGCDTRPLRILGVRAVAQADLIGQGLAISAQAFTADAATRQTVLRALDDRPAEVALLGEGWPVGIDRGLPRVHHLLSAAARVFKGHALAAAGIHCGAIASTETLFSGIAGLR